MCDFAICCPFCDRVLIYKPEEESYRDHHIAVVFYLMISTSKIGWCIAAQHSFIVCFSFGCSVSLFYCSCGGDYGEVF